MNKLNFWADWQPGFKNPFRIFGLLGLVLALLVVISAWLTPFPAIGWDTLQQREAHETVVHQFSTGPFDLSVKAESLLNFERQVGTPLRISPIPAYAFLACMLIGLTLLSAILSALGRFWFFIGTGIQFFLFSSLRLESIAVAGMENQIPALVLMVLVAGVGLYFQYQHPAGSFPLRLLAYGSVYGIAFTAFGLMAKAPLPFFYLGVSFIPVAVIVGVYVAVFASHQILSGFIYLITSRLKASNGFGHFALLTLVYLINLWAVYLSDHNWFEWPFAISPVLLMVLSGVLVVWGVRQQEAQSPGFILPGPMAPIAMLGLLIIAFSSVGFFYVTANDAATETVRSLSLYAHIGYGTIFFLYIISNFATLLKQNYPVHKVLYNPKGMPYFTYRFAGTIAVLAFIFFNFYKKPISDTKGALFAALGDYHLITGNTPIAEGYYKRSAYFAFHNHHANYVLANLEGYDYDAENEFQFYQNAAERRPTPQAYLNGVLTLTNAPLRAYTYLQDAVKDFPGNGPILNDMGLVFSQLNQPDSAFHYFNKASSAWGGEETGTTNFLAVATRSNSALQADSLSEKHNTIGPQAEANLYAFATQGKVKLARPMPLLRDTTLTATTAALLRNFFIHHRDSLDTAFIARAEGIAKLPSNKTHFETVAYGCAFAWYHQGYANRAIQLMMESAVLSNTRGNINHILALWTLEQGAAQTASENAYFASLQNVPQAEATRAIALAEAGKTEEAAALLDTLKRSTGPIAQLAETVQRVLLVDKALVKHLTDLEKYLFCRYRISYRDSILFQTLTSELNEGDWKARAIIDRSKKLLWWDEPIAAARTFDKLANVPITDPRVYAEAEALEFDLLIAANSWAVLKDKAVTKGPLGSAKKILIEAMTAHLNGDSAKANAGFKWLGANNAFFAEGVVWAGRAAAKKGDLAQYTVLANALRYNPYAPKLLKHYTLEALRLEFDDYITTALETLKLQLPPELFNKFVTNYLTDTP